MQSNLMQRLQAQRAQQHDQRDRQLYYLLCRSGQALDVQVVLAGVEPNGQLIQPQPYSLQSQHLHQPPSFVQATDQPVLAWLLEQPETHERHRRRLTGLDESACDLLQMTARVRHADRPHQAIRWQSHEPAALWQWQEAENGDQAGRLVWPSGSVWLSETAVAWDDEQALLRLPIWPTDVVLCQWLQQGVAVTPEALTAGWIPDMDRLQQAGWPLPVQRPVQYISSVCQIWVRCTQQHGASRLQVGWCYRGQLPGGELPDWFWRVSENRHNTDGPYREHLFQRVGDVLYGTQRDPKTEQALLVNWCSRLTALAGTEVTPANWSFPDTPHWQRVMTREVSQWRDAGVLVDIEPGFSEHWVRADTLETRVDLAEAGWFDLAPRLWIDGESWDFLPLLQQLMAHYGLSKLLAWATEDAMSLPLADGRWLLLDAERVQRWLGIWLDYLEAGSLPGAALRIANVHLSRLALLDNAADQRSGDEQLWAQALQQANRPVSTVPVMPPDFKATLRPYQEQGVAWLQHLYYLNLGGILADDMGLGKTLQTIAHVSLLRQHGELALPALVVAPTSVLSNWQREFSRFAPGLRVARAHGAQRASVLKNLAAWDVVITSYGTLLSDQAIWQAQSLSLLVLDEAQTIRNAATRSSQCVKSLVARQRVCLTGTPVENHLGELWSLFDFAMPGLLGSQRAFRRTYFPGARHRTAQDNPRLPWLLTRVAPFMFRRRKSEVASELPDKTEVVVRIPLGDAQSALYERVRAEGLNQIDNAQEAGSAMQVLNVLTRLRQVCCDPQLLGDDSVQAAQSAKRDYVLHMLGELVDEGRAVLVFSQFTRMLDLLAEDLRQRHLPYLLLTGQTRDRQALVDRFQRGDVPIFLISLKAGGAGLTLTQADTVIHYDPWWNQAAEQQASDRAHRIGQTRQVFVYKLIAEQTLEEKILDLQASKQSLLDVLNASAEATAQQWVGSAEQLRELV